MTNVTINYLKVNRRSQKNLYQLYRLHRADIWGVLSRASQDKRITQFIADMNRSQLISELRQYPQKISKKIKQEVLWGDIKAKKNLFLYQLTQIPKKIKPLKRTLQYIVTTSRKLSSLFYFAGRIRIKTLIKFGKYFFERSYPSQHNRIGKNHFLAYVRYKSFTRFLEARLDVLCLRVNLLSTMFSLRQALFHRKADVKGQTPLNNPGFLVKSFRRFFMSETYIKYIESNKSKKKIREKLKEKIEIKKFDYPNYILCSHTLKGFFKMGEPKVNAICYPFSKPGLSPNFFRQAHGKNIFSPFL